MDNYRATPVKSLHLTFVFHFGWNFIDYKVTLYHLKVQNSTFLGIFRRQPARNRAAKRAANFPLQLGRATENVSRRSVEGHFIIEVSSRSYISGHQWKSTCRFLSLWSCWRFRPDVWLFILEFENFGFHDSELLWTSKNARKRLTNLKIILAN